MGLQIPLEFLRLDLFYWQSEVFSKNTRGRNQRESALGVTLARRHASRVLDAPHQPFVVSMTLEYFDRFGNGGPGPFSIAEVGGDECACLVRDRRIEFVTDLDVQRLGSLVERVRSLEIAALEGKKREMSDHTAEHARVPEFFGQSCRLFEKRFCPVEIPVREGDEAQVLEVGCDSICLAELTVDGERLGAVCVGSGVRAEIPFDPYDLDERRRDVRQLSEPTGQLEPLFDDCERR